MCTVHVRLRMFLEHHCVCPAVRLQANQHSASCAHAAQHPTRAGVRFHVAECSPKGFRLLESRALYDKRDVMDFGTCFALFSACFEGALDAEYKIWCSTV